MKVTKFDRTGKQVGEVELSDDLFGKEISKSAIHAVIRFENRNRRQGTHKTKGMGEVRGGGKKPWSQKGTGNARQGSNRAPQWKGGGIVFGPVPRDYSVKVPGKMRKAGLRSILSAKAANESVCVVEDLGLDSFSTKSAYTTFKNMGHLPGNTIAFVADSEDIKLKKSLMNIPQLIFINARRLTAPELYYSGQVVIEESALKYLDDAYGAASK